MQYARIYGLKERKQPGHWVDQYKMVWLLEINNEY